MTVPQTAITVHPSEGTSRLGALTHWNGQFEAPVPATGPKMLNLGRAVLRHSKVMLAVIVVLNVIAYIGVHRLTPRYTASADVIVGPREEQVVDLKAVISGLSGSSDVIESEIQVLRSRGIGRAVVEKFNLDQMAEFNPGLHRPGLKEHLTEAFSGPTSWVVREFNDLASGPLGWIKDELDTGLTKVGVKSWFDSDATESETAQATAIPGAPLLKDPVDPLSVPVDRFLAALDVASKGRSRVITISFTSSSAVLSAKVANAVADAYIANQLRAKTDATTQAHQWLDDRVAELKEQLQAADEAVEAYRRRAGIVPLRDGSLLSQQMSEAGQELMRAREQLAVITGRVEAISAVNPNAMGLSRELSASRSRVKTLEDNLASLRQLSDAGSQSEIGLRALQREADADRNLYDRLLARARETKVQSGLQQADATVISRAEQPGEPSFPKPGIILPLFFVASCIIAFLLVIWLESLDRGFSSVGQLEASLGFPAIGSIPAIKHNLLRWTKVGTYCVDHPRSTYAEAIRNLHTSLMLSGKSTIPKTILIASSLPGEGKSSIALAMAHMMASCGQRVVIVDCDLRKPSLHKAFRVGRGPGLTECLKGRANLAEVTHRDPSSSIFFVPAGMDATTSPDLFGSNAMRKLLEQLSADYDLVLLDGAPVLGVSDTRHLCRIVDKTLFVVRWQATRIAAAEIGLRMLVDAGANVAGVLLTMIDPKYYEKSSPIGIYRRSLALYVN